MSSAEDHALGLELQLIELVEKQERARVQHRDGEVDVVQEEIDALQLELAASTEIGSERGTGATLAFHNVESADSRPVV